MKTHNFPSKLTYKLLFFPPSPNKISSFTRFSNLEGTDADPNPEDTIEILA